MVEPLSRSGAQDSLNALVSAYVHTHQYRRALERTAVADLPALDQWRSSLSSMLTDLEQSIEVAVRNHVMWPWIAGRVDANPVVAGRLLARLNPTRAPTPSAFWRFCGLATIPGFELKCDRCGAVMHTTRVRPTACTRMIGKGRRCGGACLPVTGTRPKRIAQRWITNPQAARSAYDPDARTAAYLISHDLVARSPHYAVVNRNEQERLLTARPSWSFQHRLRAARRRTTKTFLVDLWLAWRGKAGLTNRPAERRVTSGRIGGAQVRTPGSPDRKNTMF